MFVFSFEYTAYSKSLVVIVKLYSWPATRNVARADVFVCSGRGHYMLRDEATLAIR